MNEASRISEIKHKLFSIRTGIFLLVGNTFWVYITTSLLYSYNFTTKLYFYRIPIWILFFEIIFALTGIFIGQLIIRNKIKTLKWFLIDLLIVIIGISINYII